MTSPASDKNQQYLESIIEHWVDARIDAPREIIAKYDEAAKQLITIGGFLQGGLVAVYSILLREQHIAKNGWQMFGIAVFGLLLAGFLFLAAWVCGQQPGIEARPISHLLKRALQGCLCEDDLTGEVNNWCVDVERVAKRKRTGLLWAKGLFIVSFLLMNALLLVPAYA